MEDNFDEDAWMVMEQEAQYGDGKPRPLRQRTKEFALRIIRLYAALPGTTEAQVIGRQALRSGTSVGAHFREGLRARSEAEIISKLQTALQELDETDYWLELLADSDIVPADRLTSLRDETNQLLAILTTCAKRIKARKSRPKD
jgi:four helix bundle protein